MNLLFDIGHPGHVHLFKNSIRILSQRHNVTVSAKAEPLIERLLKAEQVAYIPVQSRKDTLVQKATAQLNHNLKLLSIVRKNKIDTGIGTSVAIPHVSKLTNMRSIILDDDDDAVEPFFTNFVHPFADIILSPDCISRKSKRCMAYPGFHELAYLHPDRFVPDPSIKELLGVKDDEPYFIFRFNAFKAHHDIKHHGLSISRKRALIKSLVKRGKVFITSERDIEAEFREYRINIPPEKIHSAMYYAKMFLGDSQTMTSEAALLGTPALKCNTFSGLLSVPNEIEKKYKLCYSFLPSEFEILLSKVNELAAKKELKEEWKNKKKHLLTEKIDVTGFLIWYIENYKSATKMMKENKIYWEDFK